MKPQPQPQTPPSAPASALDAPDDSTVDFRALRQNRLREAQRSAPLQLVPPIVDAPVETDDAPDATDPFASAPAKTGETAPALSPAEAKQFDRLVKSKPKTPPAPCHWGLLVAALLLTAVSVPLVYSASTAIALDQHGGDPNFFLWRQIGYGLVGLALMFGVSRVAPERLRTLAWGLYAFALVGLLATKFSPLGYSMGNVERWVKLGPLTFQFSELAKIAVIGVMADFWSRAARMSQRSMKPWIVAAALGGAPLALTFVQPHLSAALVLGVLPLAIAFFAGAPRKHFGRILVPAIVLVVLVVGLCRTHAVPGLAPYQQDRIAAKFGGDEAGDARGNNYQSLQGQRAIMRGGLSGVGLGNSLYKNGHLPAPHTDFIFAVIAEETGAWGALGLLGLYGAIVFFCFQIGHGAETGMESLLCAGVGTLWGVQVAGNIAVVTGVFPVTGLPLPILTFGGSGLWCALLGLGLVLAVSRRQCEGEE